LVVSLHGDPRDAFPYFSGFADEIGTGEGEGFNLNIPLPPGTDFSGYGEALDHALARSRDFGPDVLVVSLGVDTYEADPLGFFAIESHEFRDIGRRIAGLRRPTLFVMEGGYALADLALNVVNVLTGFEDG
jgi:acetoin utilization deacetylase AcuC-like enzyme